MLRMFYNMCNLDKDLLEPLLKKKNILMYAYPIMQNNEETFAKYAVDANPFWLGSTNPKKNSRLWMLFGGGQSLPNKKKWIWTKKFLKILQNRHKIYGIG